MNDNKNDLKSVYLTITFFACTVLFFVAIIFFIQNPIWFKPFCIFLLICAGIITGDFVIRRVTRLTYRDIGQFGTTAQDVIGRVKNYAPVLIPESPTPGRAITEATSKAPRLKQLIENSLLVKQDTDGAQILIGFREDLTPRYERMP